jgi:hypothetical protein
VHAELARSHQSDNTVHIYTSLSLLVDPALTPTTDRDADGRLSTLLSERFAQTWLVHNHFPRVAPETFHSDYARETASVAGCFLSIVYVDAGRFCAGPDDLEVFLGTLLHVNRVLGRRVLLLVPRFVDSVGAVALAQWADALETTSAGSLLSVLDVEERLGLDAVAARVGDRIAAT